MELIDEARRAADALAEVKGKDIILLELTEQASFADYFVICTGDSPVHMKALADRVRKEMADAGERISHAEGKDSQHWILLDFRSIIVHIFSNQSRPYYGLESLWGDAPLIEWTPETAAASAR